MRNILVALICVISSFPAFAEEISNIYIEAQGNNQFEARAKANKAGMARVVMMLAQKFELNDGNNIPKFKYEDLVKVFTVSRTLNEKMSHENYSATVAYQYQRDSLNKLFFQYFPKTSAKKFANYVVFPVFKQGNKISLWLRNNDWLKLWFKNKAELDKAKLIYAPLHKQFKNTVTASNILNITYDDLLAAAPNLLFKEALLVVLEHYTSASGQGYIEVEYITLSSAGSDVYNERVDVISQDEISESMYDIFENILYSYGDGYAEKFFTSKTTKSSQDAKITSSPAYILRAEIYSKAEQEELTKKLNRIKAIKKVEIVHNFGHNYRVSLFTKLSEAKLAEEFYKHKLSYVKRDDTYLLINVTNGV